MFFDGDKDIGSVLNGVTPGFKRMADLCRAAVFLQLYNITIVRTISLLNPCGKSLYLFPNKSQI